MTDPGIARRDGGTRPAAPASIAMPRPAEELLYDSEAALRLVDTALHELNGAASAPDPAVTDTPPAAAECDERESPDEDGGESNEGAIGSAFRP